MYVVNIDTGVPYPTLQYTAYIYVCVYVRLCEHVTLTLVSYTTVHTAHTYVCVCVCVCVCVHTTVCEL